MQKKIWREDQNLLKYKMFQFVKCNLGETLHIWYSSQLAAKSSNSHKSQTSEKKFLKVKKVRLDWERKKLKQKLKLWKSQNSHKSQKVFWNLKKLYK